MPAPLIVGAGIAAYRAYKLYRLYKKIQKARKAAETAQRLKKAAEAAKKLRAAKKPCKTCIKDKRYQRPSGYRKGVKDKAWEAAKGKDGKVRDPASGRVMKKDEPWDMGHKPGYEFRKHQQSAAERNISRKQFLDEHNSPSHYRPELPKSNRSHAGELKTDEYFGF